MSAIKSKYKKFLDEKSKLVSSTSTIQNTGSSSKNKQTIKFLNFFNPNKILNMKSEVAVRVLPNKEGFYHEYSKHMVKLGEGVFKQFICMHSKNKSGAEYGNCPLCDFLEDNGNELSKDSYYKLMAKTSYLMFVYNPEANEIQKYETNDFGIIDITSALVKLIDENEDSFDPDSEGFGLIFKKDKNGYAKVVEACLPSLEISEILKNTNTDEIKDFYDEIMPFTLNYTMKQINTTFTQVIKSFAPTFDFSNYLLNVDNTISNTISKQQEKDIDTDTNVNISKKTYVEPEDEAEEEKKDKGDKEDTQVSNIRDFLKNRKNRENTD